MAIPETQLVTRKFYDEITNRTIDVELTLHNAILFDLLKKIEARLARNG